MECKIESILGNMRSNDPRLPTSIKCELTYRCNFSCHHCYCRLPQGDQAQKRELSFREWDRLLGESADEGVLFLTFTGGEPLLRHDFKDIWKMAKRRGFLLTLFTNGSLITPELVDFFQEWTPADLSITIYGAREETYHAVTGVSGAYSRVVESLALMKIKKIPISTRSIITKRNIAEFGGLQKLNEQYTQFFSWDAELFGKSDVGGGEPIQERIAPAEVVELEFSHNDRRKGIERLLEAQFIDNSKSKNPFLCSIGQKGFAINPYGKMLSCMLFDQITFDVRAASVRTIWRELIPKSLNKLKLDGSPCGKCDLAFFCCICPASSFRENGSRIGPTEYHCEMGRERFKRFEYFLKNQKFSIKH